MQRRTIFFKEGFNTVFVEKSISVFCKGKKFIAVPEMVNAYFFFWMQGIKNLTDLSACFTFKKLTIVLKIIVSSILKHSNNTN